MELGDRVELTSGVLTGERATIIESPSGEWRQEDEYGVEVRIQFDRKDAHCGQEQGFAILSDRWEEVEKLKVIS